MKKRNIIIAICVALFLVSFIAYLIQDNNIASRNEKDAKTQEIVSHLKSKYNKDFVVKDYDYYFNEGGDKQWAILVYPSGQPDLEFEAFIRNDRPGVTDNYECAQYNSDKQKRVQCQIDSQTGTSNTPKWGEDY